MADRLLFSKTGRAKYISHLDLMRTFQRAFTRAGIEIKHTQGFHKHPFVSIALPLSVGYSSQCEILEFGLVGGATAELAYVNYIINFEYSEGRPQASEPAMQELLSRESLVMQKKSNKSKKGYTEVDLIPLIKGFNLECQSDTLTLDAVLCAQNPGLNPELIRAAFCQAYPDYAPDFVTFHRREVLDIDGKPFR